MKILKYPARETWNEIIRRPQIEQGQMDEIITSVFENIKKGGDHALIEFTEKFDKVRLNAIKVSDEEMIQSIVNVDEELQSAINLAAGNIEKFHASQKIREDKIETSPGVYCWQKAVPIEKVGLYIPGGSAPLFSSVLMLGIPAIIAGCSEIVLCTPPDKKGQVDPVILYTANRIGIKNIYKAGGAQAIAAMTLGTETINRVDKIFGPGNQYVTAAKQYASMLGTAIDMPAGPSEVAIMADESAKASFVAADLLSQAEHGADSQVLLVSDAENLLKDVIQELEKQLDMLPRKEVAKKALENSRLILLQSKEEMMELVNLYAPEHLIISTTDYKMLEKKVIHAGSVFLGNYTPESAGDYASGTNHTLPTNGFARTYSGVNLDSFVRKITFQEISPEGLRFIGPAIETMALAEQLQAHQNAVRVRLNEINEQSNNWEHV